MCGDSCSFSYVLTNHAEIYLGWESSHFNKVQKPTPGFPKTLIFRISHLSICGPSIASHGLLTMTTIITDQASIAAYNRGPVASIYTLLASCLSMLSYHFGDGMYFG
jgi:hypothetical protein